MLPFDGGGFQEAPVQAQLSRVNESEERFALSRWSSVFVPAAAEQSRAATKERRQTARIVIWRVTSAVELAAVGSHHVEQCGWVLWISLCAPSCHFLPGQAEETAWSGRGQRRREDVSAAACAPT